MPNQDRNLFRAGLLGSAAALLSGFAIAGAPSAAWAQDQADQATDQEAQTDEIVITGSRIRRDAFSSTTPLQVLDVGEAGRLGITSIQELLLRSTAASGQQIDATFNSNAGNSNATEAPPTGGIGSSNINLRNLGPERTLVLVNGRRLGSTGVRGAPAQPDIEMLPFAMVETVDILTGGLSTIYGADAVAGVVNVKLRTDFDGVEVGGSANLTEHGGGNIFKTSLIAGASSDRGNITVGFEYSKRERVATGQRDFSRCLRDIEVTEDGKKRFDPCRSGFFDNIIVTSNFDLPPEAAGLPLGGSDTIFFFYTPGSSDLNGVPNWSSALNIPQPADPQVSNFPTPPTNNARTRFVYNDFYNDQDERRAADLIRPQERFSLVANGHLDMDWGNNEQLYFESYYFNRNNDIIAATEQIFPDVLGQIPMEDANGELLRDASGALVLFDNPLNPFSGSVAPILTLDDVPQRFDVEAQQFRGVIGFKGDIGAGWFADNNWNYDAYFTYDRGVGFQSQVILREDRLQESLQTLRFDADGNLKCGFPIVDNSNGFLTPNECVPVNLFATSIFEDGDGRFATDAEREFLLGRRTNRTLTKQYNAALFLSGDLMALPTTDEKIGTAFGFEWRKDTIGSQNSTDGIAGGNAAENPVSEGETIGSRWIYDLYGEVSIPILTGRQLAERLQIDAAVRYTEEQNFGSEVTYRVGGLYAPVEYLRFSASYNTSFRAPNLREQFLADQGSGVSGGIDPCLATSVAQLEPTDPTTQLVVANCALSGADVTILGSGGVTTIPVRIGGADDLKAEESNTFTGTVQFSQPWYDSFDLDIAVTYYDIKITDTVEELDPETIVNRCFFDEPNLASPFCSRITRPGLTAGNAASNIINFIDASFINVGLQTSKGLDFTTRLRTAFDDVMGQTLNLGWTTSTTYSIEQDRQVFADSNRIDNAGRIGSPEWVAQSTVSLGWDRYELLWQARYIGRTEFEANDSNPLDEPFRDLNELAGTDLTRDDEVAERKFYNDVTMTMTFDTFSVNFGVKNMFDVKPPLIDDSEGPNRNNAVSSAGFDFFGRTFFLSGSMNF